MKKIISILGTAAIVSALTMGFVLGSVEFKGINWHVFHLVSFASVGGVMVGYSLFSATGRKKGSE